MKVYRSGAKYYSNWYTEKRKKLKFDYRRIKLIGVVGSINTKVYRLYDLPLDAYNRIINTNVVGYLI